MLVRRRAVAPFKIADSCSDFPLSLDLSVIPSFVLPIVYFMLMLLLIRDA